MADTRDFLGKGFAFPPGVDKATGRFRMSREEEDIRQSIYLILMTRKGERAMEPEFGCSVYKYIYELPDDAFFHLVQNEVIDALTKWEPRITDIALDIDSSDILGGKVIFQISYTVRSTNNPNNLVFPYYLYEGVGIE
ncbi:MAG TPA: GPW/gp25 family protein [Oscillospiraceae bacterium]|nr:GPW/gp25 family protein [Oscillospiraceae bacterium]HPW00419.1 GPW/gp25 family protein [Oscillospiraceae bacterium]